MEFKRVDVVRCLPERGATAPELDEWPKRKKIYNVLRDQEIGRMEKEKEIEEKPPAWNEFRFLNKFKDLKL
jgi:hypothetical protein